MFCPYTPNIIQKQGFVKRMKNYAAECGDSAARCFCFSLGTCPLEHLLTFLHKKQAIDWFLLWSVGTTEDHKKMLQSAETLQH